MTKQYSTQFERLPVEFTFFKNGNTWRKQSTRTAKIVAPGEPYHGKWFYFRQDEQVIINQLD